MHKKAVYGVIIMFVCVSSFPRIGDVIVYIHNVMQRFTYVILLTVMQVLFVTGNRLTNILNINYSYISSYAIIIKK